MDEFPEIPETKPEEQGAGGAEDDDENISEWKIVPPDPPKSEWEKQSARPKYQYRYENLPQHDKDNIPMSTFPPEKKGLPNPKCTAESSFIEGETSGRVITANSMNIDLAHQKIEQEYPQYGKAGNLLTLEVEDRKVFVFGSRGGRIRLFKADGRTLNPQLLKLKNVQETLGPTRTEIIQQKDQEIEEFNKTIEEETRVADDENEDPVVRDRARERRTEHIERERPACTGERVACEEATPSGAVERSLQKNTASPLQPL